MSSLASYLSLCVMYVCSLVTFNTLRPRQNGRHFTDDIFKCIFVNENVWIAIEISLKFVPKGPINNIPALVQIWLGAVQATSHYLNQWWLVYRRIYASLGLNELRHFAWLGNYLFTVPLTICRVESGATRLHSCGKIQPAVCLPAAWYLPQMANTT